MNEADGRASAREPAVRVLVLAKARVRCGLAGIGDGQAIALDPNNAAAFNGRGNAY